MSVKKYIFTCCFSLLYISGLNAQSNANVILRSVFNKLQKAKDYSVEANIKVDMPFIKMLPVDVKIYFKQKDKFKVESKGIAVVPRQGFDQATKILGDANSYTCLVQGEEKIGTILATIVNVIPLSDTLDVIFGKFWIDPVENMIIKSQITTKSNGTIETEYFYGNESKYSLPDKMIFSVDMKKFKIPKKFTNDSGNSVKDTNNKNNDKKKGKIYITLTNYVINKGIPDSVFK